MREICEAYHPREMSERLFHITSVELHTVVEEDQSSTR
jgi:hypothetical protein